MSRDVKTQNAVSWGSWHTGPDAVGPCPQDGRYHAVDEAVRLNDRDREYRQATMHARNKEWLGQELVK